MRMYNTYQTTHLSGLALSARSLSAPCDQYAVVPRHSLARKRFIEEAQRVLH